MTQVAIWKVFETAVEVIANGVDSLWEVTVIGRFVSPTGRVKQVEAYWDGGNIWRLRFSPDELGSWAWQVISSHALARTIAPLGGEFECTAFSDVRSLLRHGRIRVSSDGSRFVHADGTPFFWLADTAWNGALLSSVEDWQEYTRTRREQRFTGVQFVTTEGCYTPTNRDGEVGMVARAPLQVNPQFFHRLDDKIEILNQHGLLAVPVMFWSWHEQDPGRTLSERDAIRLGRYMLARWGAYHIAWFLSGDGIYQDESTERWKRIGRAIFEDRSDQLVTMHPQGVTWVGELFRHEDWYRFIGYQSGHGASDDHLNWLVAGPPAQDWQHQPRKPVINLEPNYEGHPIYHQDDFFTDIHVRRAIYWSLLIAPTAGASYGHMAIWGWQEQAAKAPCYDVGTVPGWRSGLESPGIHSLIVLRTIFERLKWWTLQPLPELVIQPNAKATPEAWITAAISLDRRTIVAYFPRGGSAMLKRSLLPVQLLAHWINPMTGEWQNPTPFHQSIEVIYAPSTSQDWLLYLEAID